MIKISRLTDTRKDTIIAGLIAAVVALVILWLSSLQFWPVTVAALLANVGSLLLVSVAIYLVFEFWLRRSWVNELFSEAQTAEQIRAAGLGGFWTDFSQVDWDSHFTGSSHMDLWVSYARTWSHQHAGDISTLLSRPGTAMRILLPDWQNEEVVGELSRRFGRDRDYVRDSIKETVKFTGSLPKHEGAIMEVRFASSAPVFTMYKFDDSVVAAMFHHRRKLDRVVTFEGRAPGGLFDYMNEEFELMWGGARPEETPAELAKHEEADQVVEKA